jgi:SsrA-binding protein
MLKKINILNKRGRYDYEIIEKFTANSLAGTEIDVQQGKVSITESFCEFCTELFCNEAAHEKH